MHPACRGTAQLVMPRSHPVRVTEVTFPIRTLDLQCRHYRLCGMPEIPTQPASTTNSPMLRVAALLTWLAIVASEPFTLEGSEQVAFVAAAVLFLLAFMFEERRTHPGWSVSLFAVVLSAAVAVHIGGFGVTPALYVICGVTLFEKLPRRQFWLVMCLLNLILLGRLLSAAGVHWALTGFASFLGFQLFGLIVAATAQALERANGELRSINAELISTRALLNESARAQERLHLSRELHDVCGHKLTALKLTLRGLPQQTTLGAEEWALCRTLTDELLGDIRSVVAQLRVHEGIDLAQALGQLGQGWRQPTVHLQLDAEARAPSVAHAETLLRVAQEGLTNAARHSAAERVEISLHSHDGVLELKVCDDGKSTAPIQRGHGLTGMAERLAELGGTLEITRLNPGLCLSACLPIPVESLV